MPRFSLVCCTTEGRIYRYGPSTFFLFKIHHLVIGTLNEQLVLLPLYRFTLLHLRNVSRRCQQNP